MKIKFFFLLLAGLILQAPFAFSLDEQIYSEYFTIAGAEEKKDPQVRVPEMDPRTYFQQSVSADLSSDFFIQARKQALFLLKFDHHNGSFGQTQEPYDRSFHYGGWSRDRRTPDCFNTRAKVLIRDSKDTVELDENSCSVARGRWRDPYTGREFYESSDIQIDHFVPLKNSYISGAWKWDYQKRCLYANFLGNPYHLIAVSGRENMIKSDKAPDRYMPPNSRYNCRYLQQWLKLKMIWDLGLTPPEVSKIRQLVEENNCSSDDLVISSEELLKQRNVIDQNLDLCRPK